MATAVSAPKITAAPGGVPSAFFNVCFVLFAINVSFFPTAYFSHAWIYDENGLGVPTDFVNVWAAGRMVLDGHPALAYEWDLQKQVELAVLKQDFIGYFAWHYPPPFLFVASFLAQFPYAAAFVGWVLISLIPYLAAMRAIVGRNFGLILALAVPCTFNNILDGQNGFLTAALIGGTLYLLPTRPVLSGICLGLLSYKPQYGLLFPLVLIAASEWKVFSTAGITAVALALASWLAFGTESWQAFFHWMPMFSQAFLTEGKGPLVEVTEHLRANSLFRRQRSSRLDLPVGDDRFSRSLCCADLAQLGALQPEGRESCRRHAADDALSVHL